MATRITDLRTGQRDYAALDDRMLVLDFQAGDPEAFVEIHRRYGKLARHVCQRMLVNRQDADEAFQETMIRVFQGLYRFNGRYALQPWIARIATNVSLDHLRTAARRPQLEDGTIEDAEPQDLADGPEEAFERLVQRDLVLSVLSGLPEKHRAALVLRELEGRSHREIAEALDISPGQAKALIHRAKGSFRRGWLLAVTERGGFAGIAVLPLLWLLKVGDLARRFVDRAGHATQVAQAGAPEVVSVAASTPAVTAAPGLTERVVAAGMTLLLAGGVTVGAATIVKNRADRGRESRIEAEAGAVAESLPLETAPSAPVVEPAGDPAASGRDGKSAPEDVGQVLTADDPLASPTVVPTPTPGETPGPSPQPTPDPPTTPPPIPPAPAWSGGFAIDWASEDLCGCGPGVSLISSTSTGSLLPEDGTLELAQKLRGAAIDAEGDPAWALEAGLEAHLRRDGGSLDMIFRLTRDGASVTYGGTAWVSWVAGDPAAGEPLVYALAGDYAAAGVGQEASPIKLSGRFTVLLSVWADGTTPVGTQISVLP